MSIQLASIDPAVINFDDVGVFAHQTALAVGNASAENLTLTAGMKGIVFQNVGSKLCWIGGSAVDPSTSKGIKLFPNQSMMFRNVASTFSIYLKCGGSDTTTIGILEYA